MIKILQHVDLYTYFSIVRDSTKTPMLVFMASAFFSLKVGRVFIRI